MIKQSNDDLLTDCPTEDGRPVLLEKMRAESTGALVLFIIQKNVIKTLQIFLIKNRVFNNRGSATEIDEEITKLIKFENGM